MGKGQRTSKAQCLGKGAVLEKDFFFTGSLGDTVEHGLNKGMNGAFSRLIFSVQNLNGRGEVQGIIGKFPKAIDIQFFQYHDLPPSRRAETP